MKKALIVIIVAIMILTFASCGNKKAFEFKDKVVTYEDISLTLTEAFYPSIENYGSDMVYESGDVYVFIDREFHRGFHDLEELAILGVVIVIRALLSFIIHWEIRSEEGLNLNKKKYT